MKISILQENLSHGLNTASRSIAPRAQLPILANVLLSTDKGRLKITAANLETGVNLWFGAKVEKEGSICIPAKILAELVASLPNDKVELIAEGTTLKVSCGPYQASFVGLPPAEFPQVATLTGKANLSFKGQALARAINQVAFAAATDEGRPVLTGVLLTIVGKQLVLVATDGYRLSHKKLAFDLVKKDENLGFKNGLLIPARTLSEVARIIGDGEEEALKLAVTPQASQIIFALGEAEIVSRLIEGQFPDFKKIIPEKGTTEVIVDKEDLVRAVRMASIFARESANIVKFAVQKAALQISANTTQVGSNVSQIEAKVTGKAEKIAFNSRYLLDFLSSADGEQISLSLSGPLSPGVFASVGDQSFSHIIMPVRVQE